MPRRDDTDALKRMLRTSRASSQFPIVFGGLVGGNSLRLTEFAGTTTNGLRGLTVLPGSGAGGRALAGRRLVAIADYRNAGTISHDYDGPVLAEGIRAVMAAPIVVDGSTRMVAYAATRQPVTWGNGVRDEFMAAADDLAREIQIRDEVDRRMTVLEGSADARERTMSETASEVAAELFELANLAHDVGLKARLTAAARRLAREEAPNHSATAALTPREAQVLTLVSYGLSYPEVAKQLDLSPTTVKGYMQTTINKLGTRNRHQAVVEGRLQGLLDS